MRKPYKVYLTRFYDILEDDFEYTYYAENERDLVRLLVADFGGIHAENEGEAMQKADEVLKNQIGPDWTIEEFLDSNLELWQDNITCYRISNIQETSRLRETN